VVWPGVELDESSLGLLRRLCDQISYLGRAESWAEIEVHQDGEVSLGFNCVPARDGVSMKRVRLMAPARRAEHLAWCHGATASSKARVPTTLLDVLRQDVGDVRRQAWSAVPGTRWVVYDLAPASLPRRPAGGRSELPTHALYRMAGPVLPTVEKTLQTAECMHKALVRWSDRVSGSPQALFTGQESVGGHAAVLPLDLDRDGRLDHLLVRAGDGFDREARQALRGGRTIHGVGAYAFTVTLLGLWTQAELEALPPSDELRILGPARRWRSATPFVLVRHPKLRSDGTARLGPDGVWLDGPEAQVRLELRRRGLPDPLRVDEVGGLSVGGREIPWYRFQRRRLGGSGRRGPDRGFGFEITFAEPVGGPLALGYGRFFGLGQFAPAERRASHPEGRGAEHARRPAPP